MALNPETVLPTRYWAVEYDGTNSAEIAAWIGGWVMEENAGTVSMLVAREQVDLAVGDRVIGSPHSPGRLHDVARVSDYDDAWTPQP